MFKNIMSIIVFFFSQQQAISLNEALTNGSKCQESAKETKIDWFWKFIIFIIICHLWVCRNQSKMLVRGMSWPFQSAIILEHLIFLLYYRIFFLDFVLKKKTFVLFISFFFFVLYVLSFHDFSCWLFFLTNEKY